MRKFEPDWVFEEEISEETQEQTNDKVYDVIMENLKHLRNALESESR